MRYFIVKYIRRMHGRGPTRQLQMDEEISVSKKVRRSDIQTAAVILDFQKLEVVQASLEGNTIPKDFHKITSYYHKHYARTIDDLCKANGVSFQDADAEPTPAPAADQT